MGVTESRFDSPVQIAWEPGRLPEIVDEAEVALGNLAGQPIIYQRGGLVRIVRLPPTSARHVKRAAGRLGIALLDVPGLVDLLTKACQWVKHDKRSDTWRQINAPHEVASVMLSRGQWGFYPLTGLIGAPTLRPDGTVLDRPGYDVRTGLYFDPGECDFPPIPERPTRNDALGCIDQLREILVEFPFAGEVDRAVALALILTALVRQSLSGAPLFGISAVVMGSGKTYLAQAVALLAYGVQAAVIAPPRDSKEEDKQLFSALLEGDPILVYDNVEHHLASDMLCAILTAESMRGRVLGTSKSASVSTACTFIATGNNLTVAGDLSARALMCRLKPTELRPEHRRFARDLTTWIPEQRGRLVSAALTFLRAFLVSGERPRMEPWQRFRDWDALIRASLIWIGSPDPLESLRDAERADPRRVEHATVMRAWFDANAGRQRDIPARELKRMADDQAAIGDHVLKDALVDVAGERGEVNLRRLGKWLAKMAGRVQVVDVPTGQTMVIERGDDARGVATWRLLLGGVS